MCRWLRRDAQVFAGLFSLVAIGCSAYRGHRPEALGVRGSDTMLILAQAWSEAYAVVDRNVAVEVSGGGSGQGIAALIKGTIDIANCSRNLRPEEAAAALASTGKEPKEFVVGHDALAVFVHHENPLEEISMEQLAEIYRRDGTLTRWSQIGVGLPSGRNKIVRVNRQSSSGTYEFFRDHVLGGRDFHLASLDMNGSKEVVELIASTPGAIGYSGMAFATPDVKILRVSIAPGQPAQAPTAAGVVSKRYPISRSLLIYTLGEPRAPVRKYIDWIRSPEGQRIVADTGYVPIRCEGKDAAGKCVDAGTE